MNPVTGLAREAGKLSSVHMGNLILVTEMKNVQKASKIPMEQHSNLTSHAQLKMICHGQSQVSGLECSSRKMNLRLTKACRAKTKLFTCILPRLSPLKWGAFQAPYAIIEMVT